MGRSVHDNVGAAVIAIPAVVSVVFSIGVGRCSRAPCRCPSRIPRVGIWAGVCSRVPVRVWLAGAGAHSQQWGHMPCPHRAERHGRVARPGQGWGSRKACCMRCGSGLYLWLGVSGDGVDARPGGAATARPAHWLRQQCGASWCGWLGGALGMGRDYGHERRTAVCCS